MEREEIQQTWKEKFKEELGKELAPLTPHATFRMRNPPKINKKGVECSNHFGGRVKGKVKSLMENVLNKMNSPTQVQWLSEDKFKMVKEGQTKEKGTNNPPNWCLRVGDFPQLNCLYEHMDENTKKFALKKDFLLTGMAKPSQVWKNILATS